MRKRGRIEIEVFMVLITVVLTSAVILLLVKSGTIKVKDEVIAQPILNAEFLPTGKEGFLVVKEVRFCSYVDENLNCVSEQERFGKTENVYVWFTIESTVLNGQVIAARNYRIRNPAGMVVLQADNKNSYDFQLDSAKKTEPVVFADYFVMGEEAASGEYTLEIMVENPLLGKQVTLTKKFMVGEA